MPTKKAIAKACSGACRAKRPKVSKGIPGSWMAPIASLTRWLAARIPAQRQVRQLPNLIDAMTHDAVF
jgi:hypothetical protein